MRASILAALVVFMAIVIPEASLAADDRPAGIAVKNWLPISDRLGFVVETESERPRIIGGSREILLADPDRVSAELQPPKRGYFVIKTAAGWQRVVVSNPADLAG